MYPYNRVFMLEIKYVFKLNLTIVSNYASRRLDRLITYFLVTRVRLDLMKRFV